MLQPVSHGRSVFSTDIFMVKCFMVKCFISVSNLVPPIRMFECETRLSACSHPYTLALLRCRTKSHSNSFIPHTASLCNSLPGACFHPFYNLDCFKKTVLRRISIPTFSSPSYFHLKCFLLVASYQEWPLPLFGGKL